MCKFLKQAYPGINVGSTVVGMNHSHRMACRSCHHIYFRMKFFQGMFQDKHAENGGSRRYISGSYSNTIGSHHPCSRIPFRRCYRAACFQSSCRIQKSCPLLRQSSGFLSCHHNLRHKIQKLPRIFPGNLLIKAFYHLAIVIFRQRINREHSRSISNPQHSSPGHFPMDITGKSCDIGQFLHMLFSI